MAEDFKMAGWHHRFNVHEFEQTAGDHGGTWCTSVYGIAKSQTQFNN